MSTRHARQGTADIPPMALDAERAVLGALLLEGSGAMLRVAGALQAADFYTEAHRVVYHSMLRLHGRGEPVDVLMLQEDLRRAGELELAGGPATLALLLEQAQISVNLQNYVALVSEASRRREYMALGERLRAGAMNGASAADLSAWTAELQAAHRARDARRRPDEAPSELNALLAHRFPVRLNLIGRSLLPREGLLVLGGKPKLGKSLALDNLCLQRARGAPWLGFPTDPGVSLIVQSEMRPPAVADRFRTMLKDDPDPVPDGRLHIKTRRGVLLDTPEGFSQIMTWLEETGADLLRIDPLARHMAGDENSNRDMGAIVQAVDTLIERYGVAVILAHHPTKPTKDQPRTGGDRLRGAGALFGAADTVVMMDRTEDGFALTFDLRGGREIPPMRVTRTEDLWLIPTGPDPELLAIGALVARAPLPYNTLRGAAQEDLGLTRATATRRITAAVAGQMLVKDADGLYIAGPAYHATGSRAHKGSPDA